MLQLKSEERQLSLEGRIINQNGEPVPYAKVQLPEYKAFTYSNSDGKYNLEISKDASNASLQFKITHISYIPLDTVLEMPFRVTKNDTGIVFVMTESPYITKDIVVTGTRTYKYAENIPIPTDVITNEEITRQGNLKLDQILQDQLGAPLHDRLGRGAQIQGLDADYSLILINGEPVVGRTGGILNFSRFSVGNVKRIEVVKGPSSSLYGSNALAGVINILTEKPAVPLGANGSIRYGTFNLMDITVQTEFTIFDDKLAGNFSANRYSTDGYNVSDTSIGLTVPKLASYTFWGDVFYDLSPSSKFVFRGRYNFDDSDNRFNILSNGDSATIASHVRNDESNISINFDHKFTQYFDLSARLYRTSFATQTKDKYEASGDFYNEYKFEQGTNKIELQSNVTYSENHRLTIGGGGILDEVKAADIADGGQNATQFYSYLQDDFILFDDLNIISSIRYDKNSRYASHFSPKVAASYKLISIPEGIFLGEEFIRLTLTGSIGNGFKAPNFEQLYLNWTNPLAGYSVFGVNFVQRGIQKLGSEGQLLDTLVDISGLGSLKPETSWAFDVGFSLAFGEFLDAKVNFFRNNISEMIEFLPIAVKTNGSRVHTYVNLNRIYTQGIGLSMKIKPADEFETELKYQYLQTADLDVLEKYENGEVYYRNREGDDIRVDESQYGGLFYKPRHSGVVKFLYNNQELGFTASLRGVFQGKTGWTDVNKSLYLDDPREYAAPNILWNMTLSQQLFDLFTLQFGMDNIFDYTDTRMLAVSPGRSLYLSLLFNTSGY